MWRLFSKRGQGPIVQYHAYLPASCTVEQIEVWLDELAQVEGLSVGPTHRSRTVSGSYHWQIRSRQASGTLDLTFDRLGSRASVAGRGPWAEGAAGNLAERLQQTFRC
jgi:hypothetical protein